jgi:hypothetical protein
VLILILYILLDAQILNLNILFYFVFIFFDVSTQDGGGMIQTNDLRFMRRGPQPIKFLL